MLQRSLPWWIAALLPADSADLGGGLFLTTAQRLQVGTMISANPEGGQLHRKAGSRGIIAGCSAVSVQAMLTQGRFYRMVNRNKGDGVWHVDTADFLSCDGRELTSVPGEVELLRERTRQGGLTSPFWLSEEQTERLCAYQAMRNRMGCDTAAGSSGGRPFQTPGVFAELTCGSSVTTRYVNVEMLSTTTVPGRLQMCLSAFRCFLPINVRTRRRFEAAVDVCLRVECLSSGCWCTIWGTAEDYKSCGFRVLDGALGVDVFDELGNPTFLIHALCTTTPLDVFAACYPEDSLCAAAVL